MPVLEGKAALLAHLVGVNAVPIALRSQEPDDIIGAIAAISPAFGVVQLEDIASPKCFEIEPRVQERLEVAVFHDDQHGTAAVVLAALINACYLAETPPQRLLIGQIGLGAAGLAIARSVMHYTGNPVLGADRSQEAIERIVETGGTASDIDEVLAKCDVVIATTGVPGLIEPSMVRPGQIIFALSNPRPEIDAALAIDAGARIAEGGAAINNLLCYPGACRGLLDAGARRAPQALFTAASEAIVAATPKGQLLPNPLEKGTHRTVARAVALAAVNAGVATRDLDADYLVEE
jgi:malate dehydrogenase (oxaloacetate-decarboxylating)